MEVKIKVIRQSDSGTQTLGDMFVFANGKQVFKCETLELPWKNNQNQISCFPKGMYSCKKVGPTEKIPYNHIAILNVPGRDGIRIHRANYVSQLRGCIAVGKQEIDLNGDGQKDVSDSKNTLEALMNLLPDAFVIEVS